jgi:hypothetical protein
MFLNPYTFTSILRCMAADHLVKTIPLKHFVQLLLVFGKHPGTATLIMVPSGIEQPSMAKRGNIAQILDVRA